MTVVNNNKSLKIKFKDKFKILFSNSDLINGIIIDRIDYLEKFKCRYGGFVVCSDGNIGKKLIAEVEYIEDIKTVELEVKWGMGSPAVGKKWDKIPGSNLSRFEIPELKAFNKLSLILVSEEGKRSKLISIETIDHMDKEDISYLSTIKDNINLSKKEFNFNYWRKMLNNVSFMNRNYNKNSYSDWLKASIYLNFINKKEPKSTFQEIKKLKKLDTIDFQNFWLELSKEIYPYTLTQHGYLKSLKSKDSNLIWLDIEKLIDTLKSLGYESIVISGTLLGLIRDGDFIAHDDDVDLAVMLKASKIEEIEVEWPALQLKLEEIGVLKRRLPNVHHVKLESKFLSVDLFPSWIINDKLYIYPHTFGEVDSKAFYPIKKIKIKDAKVLVPNRSEKILSLNYGESWKEPDPSWSFDWGNAHKKFAKFLPLDLLRK